MEKPDVERTDDGRYIIVKGRKWRATDPNIPPGLKDELVRELMSARRAIKAGDSSARARVHAAKTALGERGEPWWERTDDGQAARAVAAATMLLRARDGGPVSVDDVSQIVGGEAWREAVPLVEKTLRAGHDDHAWVFDGVNVRSMP